MVFFHFFLWRPELRTRYFHSCHWMPVVGQGAGFSGCSGLETAGRGLAQGGTIHEHAGPLDSILA